MSSSTDSPGAGRIGLRASTSPGIPLSSIAGRVAGSTESPRGASLDLIGLIYELLDAHRDTADLAGGLGPDDRWAAHLDYLRALQRMGRRALAEMSTEDETDRIANAEAL